MLGPEHSETIDATGNLGRLLMERGRFDEAQQVYETALAASRKAHPEPHVDVGYLLASLGRLALERKQYAEAERRYREAIGIYEKTLPAGHGYTAAALTMLGRAQLELGRPQEAEATLQACAGGVVDGLRRQESRTTRRRARFSGRTWAVQRRFAEAEPALIETYPVLVQARLDDQLTATVRRWIEDLYRATGRPQQAQAYFQQVQAEDRTARAP